MNQPSKSKIAVLILVSSILVLGGFTCWPVIKGFAQIDYEWAQFLSPGDSANRISFYDGRIIDRDLFLYAEPKGQKAQLIYSLAWRPDASFSCAQWTGKIEALKIEGTDSLDMNRMDEQSTDEFNSSLTPTGFYYEFYDRQRSALDVESFDWDVKQKIFHQHDYVIQSRQ